MAVKHSERDSSGFGILSHEVKDNVYMMGRSGFIYTAPWIDTRDTRPPSAAVLLSVGEGRFTVSAGGQEWRGRAILVPPFVPRSLLAANVPLVCFHVMPASPHYDALNGLAKGRISLLDRGQFGNLEQELEALFRGGLPACEAEEVYQEVLRVPFRHMPVPPRVDPRAGRLRTLLEAQPEVSLAQLAEQLGVSYFWASRVISDVFGMSLRDYKAWRKLQRVFELLHSDRSITEIAHAAGFTDSAHLSRTYQRWFGQPPSYSRNRRYVRILRCW
ncbi:helix-turn-helix domain-containing protein [Alloalcanivorax xenomutans]|jgi:AraC family transcriptional regulator, arabinose operon regulatory protein|uniref:helix-turn-helix domain-containing protein n=1 Tax=Alloalcanivorax xenomutans TaxID=1094342 RepID=UPI0003B8F527|nr:helix-turn-helix transcriptional regulator [Alloalcanivorax xenomutans]ERS13568.1 hypothetical protein Q668_13665 [Alcanivorax sp. PN-3]WOA32681.1 helix-turn-helix transcriptional regulator [Alloalcanivorax xenomutans]